MVVILPVLFSRITTVPVRSLVETTSASGLNAVAILAIARPGLLRIRSGSKPAFFTVRYTKKPPTPPAKTTIKTRPPMPRRTHNSTLDFLAGGGACGNCEGVGGGKPGGVGGVISM